MGKSFKTFGVTGRKSALVLRVGKILGVETRRMKLTLTLGVVCDLTGLNTLQTKVRFNKKVVESNQVQDVTRLPDDDLVFILL